MKFILAIIIILAFAACAYGANRAYVSKKKPNSKMYTFVGLAFMLFVAFIFIPFGFNQVEAGQVAIVKVWGEAKEIRTAGLHFVNVVSTKLEIYDLTAQEVNNDIEAYSKDAQSMTANLVIQFRIKADSVISIAKEFGDLSVLTSRISSLASERTKVVLSSESAMDLILNRGTLSARIEQSLVQSTAQYHIDITMVALTDITFSEAFELTVEQKMIAEQEQLRAEYEKQKAITEAQRDLEVAILNAEAELEKAKGIANAEIEIAKAQAEIIKIKSVETARMFGFEIDANGEIVMENKTAAEIKLISDYIKYIEYLNTWDGKLPTVIGDGDTSVWIPLP